MRKAMLFTSTLALSIAAGLSAYAASPGDVVLATKKAPSIQSDSSKYKAFFTYTQSAQPVSYVLMAAASPEAIPHDEQQCPEKQEKQTSQQPPVKPDEEALGHKLIGPEPLYFAF